MEKAAFWAISLAALASISIQLPAPSTTALAANGDLPALGALERQGAQVAAFAVALDSGQVLVDHNSTTRLTPASVTKLVLGAAALERWGSEHVFYTRFWADGPVRNGVLEGNLILEGVGDPYLTNEKLWFLATDVGRRGIRTVKGNLVLNTSAFAPTGRDSSREAGALASQNAYDSPLSAAGVNFGVLAAVVSPGDGEGKPAQLGLEPYAMPGFFVTGQVRTGRSETKPNLTVTRRATAAGDEIRVEGTIPSNGFPARVYRSVSEADTYAGSVISAFLKQAGVELKGRVDVDNNPLRKNLTPVAEVDGYPLAWQMQGLMKVSNNYIADMLTLKLDKAPQATLAGGSRELENYLHGVLDRSRWHNKSLPFKGPLVLQSGSGLTPENRMAPRDVVAVLESMYENTREFPSFLAALPIVGGEGTVKNRFTKEGQAFLRDRIRAKTGTLSQPRDAVGLAGFVRLSNLGWVAFAVLVNGTERFPHPGIPTIRAAMDADLARRFPAP